MAGWLVESGVPETSAKNAAFFSQGRPGLARFLLVDDDLLPKLAGTMNRLAGLLRKEPQAPGLYPLGEALLALADLVQQALVRVEKGELPEEYYLLPWRRPSLVPGEEDADQVSEERRRELGRDALQYVLDCVQLTLWQVQEEGGPWLAAAAAPLFAEATSLLDVNLREEQVVDYLLVKLPDARI